MKKYLKDRIIEVICLLIGAILLAISGLCTITCFMYLAELGFTTLLVFVVLDIISVVFLMRGFSRHKKISQMKKAALDQQATYTPAQQFMKNNIPDNNATEKYLCPECGEQNARTAKSCHACGYPFSKTFQLEQEILENEKAAAKAEQEAKRLEKELAEKEAQTKLANENAEPLEKQFAQRNTQAKLRKEEAERRKQEVLKKLQAESSDAEQIKSNSVTEESSVETSQSQNIFEEEFHNTNNGENNSATQTTSVATTHDTNPERQKKSSIKQKIQNLFHKKTGLIPLAVLVILFAVIGYNLSASKITGIYAFYNGDTEAGTILDSSNDGFSVYGKKENGKHVEISHWTIKEPITLEADMSSKVSISYKSFTCDCFIDCTTSKITEISAEYKGDTSDGVVIDNDSDIVITATHKNGKESVINSGWKIETPVTLQKDSATDVVVVYESELTDKPISTTMSVTCSTHTLESISVKYNGNTKEGTIIDSKNSGIHVTAHFKNDITEEVENWEIKEPVTLAADGVGKVTIVYQDKTCELQVTCSTVSESGYKQSCERISYDNLARDPDTYEGKRVKFTGEVVQVMEGEYITSFRINISKYSDTVYVLYSPDDGDPRILEDDSVTFYGEYTGLYTYTTVLGASVTIPSVVAKYIDIN